MEFCLLRVLDLLSVRGYYARGEEDRSVLQSQEKRGLVERKRGTQNIYVITEFGRAYLENSLYGREVSIEEFLRIVVKSYRARASPMKPFVKVRDLKREIVEKERISNSKIEKYLLSLHDQGQLTLQSGLQAEVGGIPSPAGGTYEYVMVEGVF